MTAKFPFDAVTFDCDGVLVASERLVMTRETSLRPNAQPRSIPRPQPREYY